MGPGPEKCRGLEYRCEEISKEGAINEFPFNTSYGSTQRVK